MFSLWALFTCECVVNVADYLQCFFAIFVLIYFIGFRYFVNAVLKMYKNLFGNYAMGESDKPGSFNDSFGFCPICTKIVNEIVEKLYNFKLTKRISY